MRRATLTCAIGAVLLALSPASALARQHHSRHHSRVKHARIRHERFGDLSAPAATATPAPTTPGGAPADSVGRVGSISNGMLTIDLTNGSTVTGAVVADTEIECESSMSQTVQSDDGGGDNHGDNQGGGDENGGQDNDQDDQAVSLACSAGALTPGAFVRGAELSVSGTGAVWGKVELIS